MTPCAPPFCKAPRSPLRPDGCWSSFSGEGFRFCWRCAGSAGRNQPADYMYFHVLLRVFPLHSVVKSYVVLRHAHDRTGECTAIPASVGDFRRTVACGLRPELRVLLSTVLFLLG